MDHDHSHHMHHHVENSSVMPAVTQAVPDIHSHHDHSAHGTNASTGNVVNHAVHHMMEMSVSIRQRDWCENRHNPASLLILVPRRLRRNHSFRSLDHQHPRRPRVVNDRHLHLRRPLRRPEVLPRESFLEIPQCPAVPSRVGTGEKRSS